MNNQHIWRLTIIGLCVSFVVYVLNFGDDAKVHAGSSLNSSSKLVPALDREHVLVTNGATYLGAHVVLELLEAGHAVTVMQGYPEGESMAAMYQLLKHAPTRFKFLAASPGNQAQLQAAVHAAQPPISTVVHIPRHMHEGHSFTQALKYYTVLTEECLSVLAVMKATGIKQLLVSSLFAVYGLPSSVPLTEDSPLQPGSPLGHALRLCEEALAATAAITPGFTAVVLRHGRPVGMDSRERLGPHWQDDVSSVCIPRVPAGQLSLRKPLASLPRKDAIQSLAQNDTQQQDRSNGSSSNGRLERGGPFLITSSQSGADPLLPERQERELGQQQQQREQQQDQHGYGAAAGSSSDLSGTSGSSEHISRTGQGAAATAGAERPRLGAVSCAQEVVYVSDVATAFVAVLEEGLGQQPVVVYVIGPGLPPSSGASRLTKACQDANLFGAEGGAMGLSKDFSFNQCPVIWSSIARITQDTTWRPKLPNAYEELLQSWE